MSTSQPENNYLSVSEYAAIVGLTFSDYEIERIEAAIAKICAFGGIATLETFDHTSQPITASPVAILTAVIDLYLSYGETPPAKN